MFLLSELLNEFTAHALNNKSPSQLLCFTVCHLILEAVISLYPCFYNPLLQRLANGYVGSVVDSAVSEFLFFPPSQQFPTVSLEKQST